MEIILERLAIAGASVVVAIFLGDVIYEFFNGLFIVPTLEFIFGPMEEEEPEETFYMVSEYVDLLPSIQYAVAKLWWTNWARKDNRSVWNMDDVVGLGG